MCGICGIYDFNQNNVLKKDILRMNKSLIHRGPDEQGHYLQKNIALANCRLAIIDLKSGRQPICNENKKIWIVFNGEIYNYQDLKNKLIKKGHSFSTQSDTEVILHLYEEEGDNFLNKLDGMFALAMWDKKQKRIILARDRLGKKPLYWTIFQNKFIFASEVKAILTYPAFKKTIDKDAVRDYFCYGFVPSPKTIFKNISKLPAGCSLTINKHGKTKLKKYWDFDYSVKLNNYSEKEIINTIISLLKKAVLKRLISDVPLGLMLSGGIDSGLVAAILKECTSSFKIKAYSIGFEEKAFDESFYAKKLAKHLDIKHYVKIFTQRQLIKTVQSVVDTLDEPMSDPSILPTYFLSNFVGGQVKVALSGDGGDEGFAGYPKYLAHRFLPAKGWGLFRQTNWQLNLGKIGQLINYMNHPLPVRNQLWINPFSPQEITELTGVNPSYAKIDHYHRLFKGKDSLDEAFYLDQKLTLADMYLVKVDRASMASSLEVRSPFLDKDLVEFSTQIPAKLKLKNLQTKYLLKKIAYKYLPVEIVNQPKKGFGIPLDRWIEGELGPMVSKHLNLEQIQQQGLLNPKLVDRIVKAKRSNAIWRLLVFQLWREKWLN